jgi:hypothetical protein
MLNHKALKNIDANLSRDLDAVRAVIEADPFAANVGGLAHFYSRVVIIHHAIANGRCAYAHATWFDEDQNGVSARDYAAKAIDCTGILYRIRGAVTALLLANYTPEVEAAHFAALDALAQ